MHKIYTSLLFAFFMCFSLFSQNDNLHKGYIHTKNNYQLTGFIGQIDHTLNGSMVLFVNDFGTPYYLHPALIKGFVFNVGPVLQAYESKLWEDKWMFLSVEYAGENIRLLKTPDKLINFAFIDGHVTTHQSKIDQYWLELPGHRIQPIKKFGFRHQMKKLIREVSPSLAAKIGKRGYRFKNLYTILDEYDQEWSKGKRRL